MTIDVDMKWVPDEYGYGHWNETAISITCRIADRFGFQRDRIVIDDESIFYNSGVAEECEFTVNDVRYNVRFNYNEPEKSRILAY